MATFEQLLVKYIYQHKKVSLQGFGTLVLNANIPDHDLIHKNKHLPIEGLIFEYDNRAGTDENFIDFFSQQRGKIKPLAISDIESHLQLARQLMNIGKPYEVDGLGMFSTDKNGNTVFTPGNFTVPLAENQGMHNRIKERTEVQEKIETEERSGGISTSTKKALIGFAVVVLLGLTGWLVWSQFFATNPDAAGVAPIGDSTQLYDSATVNFDSAQTVSSTNSVTDMASDQPLQWKAYFRDFNDKEKALEKLRIYQGTRTPVMLETNDSVNFRMYILLESTLADTARKTDSLRRFYARPVTLEKVNP